MRQVINIIGEALPTLINLVLFLVLLVAFILVFFFPETAGNLMGTMVKAFRDVFFETIQPR